MATLIKKKWIGDDQVDGLKILLEEGQSLRQIRNGVEVDVITVLDDKIAAEESARIAADSQLQSNIDAVESQITAGDAAVQSNLDAETAARIAADETLQDNIDAEVVRAQAAEALLIPLSQKGAINGVATLDGSGHVPASQLPSYVDDVLEFTDLASFPATGESGKIYVAMDTGKIYRWSGSLYIEISPSEVNSVNGQSGNVVLDSDDINEGSSNLYFTEARAQAANDARFLAVEGEVDALQAKAYYKKKVVLTATDVTNGYIDLDHIADTNSTTANVDRLAIFEGDDYTISTVGGVSRMTFVGALTAPGNPKLDPGDVIHVKYRA